MEAPLGTLKLGIIEQSNSNDNTENQNGSMEKRNSKSQKRFGTTTDRQDQVKPNQKPKPLW